MTKQTKIATKILERAYARELIKAAVGQSDFGAGSYTPPGQPKPANSSLTTPGKALTAAGTATGNFFGNAGHGLYGAGHGLGGNLFGAGARIGQGLSYGNYALTGNKQYLNDAAARGAAARSFESNARAGWETALQAPSRMFSALDEPSPMQTLQAQQGAKLGPSEQALFNTANGAAELATGSLATGPAFGAASKVLPAANNGMSAYFAGNAAYQSLGGPQAIRVLANTVGMGNQAQAAEPQSAQPAPAGVNYNQMAADLNSGNPEMQDAANEFATENNVEQSGVNYNQMADALNNGQPEMQDAATAFAAENNTDQTEVAQDAAATPAQPVVPPVAQQPAATAEQPPAPAVQPAAAVQPTAQPGAQPPAPAEAAKPDYTQQWAAAKTPEAQKKVIQDLAASLPAVSEDHAIGAKDVAAGNLNTDAARKFIDEKLGPVGDEYIKSITAQNPSDPTLYGKAQGMWNSAVNAIGHEGMAALGLGVPLALLGMMGGSGIATLLGVLGIGAAGLFGAANGAFGEDSQRMMGQGIDTVGRMMGMNIPEGAQPVDKLVGENAPANIHAEVMNSAPSLQDKIKLFRSADARKELATKTQLRLKELDAVKQLAGLSESVAVPWLMHAGRAQGKPLTADVAKQVYRNAVQTAQMASEKDSPMAKQIAMGQQYVADHEAYVKPYQQAAGVATELGKMTNVGRLADLGTQGANWAYDKYKNLKW